MDFDRIAEQREAAWDAYCERFPKCTCCGHPVLPGTAYLPLKDDGIICETCIDDNMETMEEDLYE